MSDPMPTIIDTLRGAAAIHKAEMDPRAGLVGMFERHADWHDGKAWIPVETAADLVLDGEDAEAPVWVTSDGTRHSRPVAGEGHWEFPAADAVEWGVRFLDADGTHVEPCESREGAERLQTASRASYPFPEEVALVSRTVAAWVGADS